MKVYRKFISVLLVAPIFLLATFCCCIEKAAFAAPEIGHCSSHADSSQVDSDEHSSHSKANHVCCCPKLLGEFNGADSFQLAALPLESHHFYPLVTEFIQKYVLPTARFLSFHSPPKILVASLPLYLKYSVLRL